ncbi:hypothetical protein DXB86_03660 [Collinsella sp. OM06-18AC]|uniref:Spy0128 family protein n=1 Tax=Collinsella sp. OM06-18AC TaxID=2292327 RepID=UPI000E43AFE9|nr:FctA domain-containing protein [Collinsella sp. OM06-18AC]RGM94338.1 hypothetical protein DXB86_03660 [Collinsella sp. OM06-18AC]
MKANSDKSKQSNKATRRVLAGVLCGASVLSLVLSLVMPPISQAIANDAEAVSTEETVMGGSSSESAGVDNTANEDAVNQDSDGAVADDDVQSEEQSKDESQAEDNEAIDDGAGSSAEEAVASEETATDINNADDLQRKLLGVGENKAASFKLSADIDYAGEITLNENGSMITLDLNGFKITHSGDNSNKPLFNIANNAALTLKNSKQGSDQKQDSDGDNNGRVALMGCDSSGIPTKLTYYVTESTPNGTGTTETLYRHEVSIKGAIVGTAAGSTMKLINVYAGGTFNLDSGVLTQKKNCNVGNLIYAENGSTVNMSGGYVCGASSSGAGAGAGIMVSNANGGASTLNLTGGVIAGNYASNGGGVYANGSTINMTGGTISGNGTFKDRSGYGAGVCAVGSTVVISGGYITNNNYQFYNDNEGSTKHIGNGCHGGGGIAAFNNGSLTINGGYITGNYSAEAGGGIYAGAWNQALSLFSFSGGSIASNVAQNSEGGGIRIAAPTVGEFNVIGEKAYITNNTTNTPNDWGGGGVFVQGGNSAEGVNSACLKISNALITKNSAKGYGGGFAACPSGKTAITDANGIAIFGNTDANGENLSGGTNGKNEDQPSSVDGGEITDDFKRRGHEDLFLIRKSDNADYIAAVTGQMLGGGAANWSGTIDGQLATIGKYDGAQAKYMIGLKSKPSAEDQNAAIGLATLYITGNSSNIHGGGIMTNGDVVAGSTREVKVYPKMKLNGTKVLEGGKLKGNDFDFQLLRQNKIINELGEISYTIPSFDSNGDLQLNRCSVVDTVKNDENGNLTFDLGEVYADDDLVYYLVEVPGTDKDKGVTYDKTIYKIDPEVVKDEGKSHNVLDIKYTYYKVKSVSVTKVKNDGAGARTPETEPAAVTEAEGENAVIVALTSGATFTNKFTPYDSKGSWTPMATKVVEGGEMKEFTLEFADNDKFDKAEAVKTKANDKNSQLLSFNPIEYKLDQLNKLETDPTGRGASKTFTYFVREQQSTTPFTNYKYDRSVYQITVNATDDSNHHIDVTATYKQIQDRDGNLVTNGTTYDLTDTSTPTFINTYSTSLPLSGMSGVTLTYLAGAAVLCAAAAWMHIRRKANAKGGERRE